ncbi:MAG: bifunctional enoyl-CoA hydratase/phosphate acetyltransferase [bacterium]
MKFNEIIDRAKSSKKKLSVACADDSKVMRACINAHKENIAEPIFVGNKSNMQAIAEKENLDISGFEIVNEENKKKAVEKAVKLVSDNEAHFLMKGFVDTSVMLKGVLNKEWGLRTGRLLSHVALFELDKYHKPFMITDGGMNIRPDLKSKIDILNNAAGFFHRIGIERPKAAVLGAVEKVNPDMPETIDASYLSKMADRGQIEGMDIDGPLAFDLAVSSESARHKGVESTVAGDADILLVPDIASGNMLAKSLIYMTDCKVAGMIVGAKCPIVLLSRSDSEETKKMSIAVAAM